MRLLSYLLLALFGAFSLVLAADSSAAENSTAAANPLAALPLCAVCGLFFLSFLFVRAWTNKISKNVLRRLLRIPPATQMT